MLVPGRPERVRDRDREKNKKQTTTKTEGQIITDRLDKDPAQASSRRAFRVPWLPPRHGCFIIISFIKAAGVPCLYVADLVIFGRVSLLSARLQQHLRTSACSDGAPSSVSHYLFPELLALFFSKCIFNISLENLMAECVFLSCEGGGVSAKFAPRQ